MPIPFWRACANLSAKSPFFAKRVVGPTQGQKRLSVIAPFPGPGERRAITAFDRKEFTRISTFTGVWSPLDTGADYAIDFSRDVACFSAFRRHAERPEIRIEKRPQLRLKQGAFALVSEHGIVLKRGDDLAVVLARLSAGLCGWYGTDLTVEQGQSGAQSAREGPDDCRACLVPECRKQEQGPIRSRAPSMRC